MTGVGMQWRRITRARRDGSLPRVLPVHPFVREEIETAQKGGYLTVKILAEKATAKFECATPIKKHRMKRALKRLGYEYKARTCPSLEDHFRTLIILRHGGFVADVLDMLPSTRTERDWEIIFWR